jgi:hypothetical protein
MSNPQIGFKVTKAKAYVAAVGGTLTALTTALATAQVVLADDAVDLGEVSTVLLALVTLATTVYGVWKVPYVDTNSGSGTLTR